MRVLLGVLVFMGISMTSTLAQEATAPCSGEEYRQLYFWVGTWDLSWKNSDGTPGSGTNVITRTLGTCVIEENFSMPGFTGRSLSIFHKPAGKWRQVWVDDQGEFFDLVGGPDAEGFKLDLVRLSDKAPTLRMIWRNVEEGSLDWYWQQSKDEGVTWETRWHIHYERASS